MGYRFGSLVIIKASRLNTKLLKMIYAHKIGAAIKTHFGRLPDFLGRLVVVASGVTDP